MTSITMPDQAPPRTRVADQPAPPQCPYNNAIAEQRHPDGLNARTCAVCRAHTAWIGARRRAGLSLGDYVAKPSTIVVTELRRPVPKCGLPHRTAAEKRTCRRCRDRGRYTDALRRDALNQGQAMVGRVDSTEAARHINEVLLPSGLKIKHIAEQSGAALDTISRTANRQSKQILAINEAAILSVRPLPYPQHGHRGTVSVVGARRILQGLYAQGWMITYLTELSGAALSSVWKWLAADDRGFAAPEVVELVKRLRDKLGQYDIAELDKPMDGMSWRSAQRAANRGWVVLADWDGLDIEDPRVTPHSADTLEASNGLVLVDPDKIDRFLNFRPVEHQDGTLTADRCPLPLTKLELYEVIRAGSERGHTGEPRVSAHLLSQRLGVAERTVQRYREEVTAAARVLDVSPPLTSMALAAELVLATTEWPAVLRIHAVRNMLAGYPLGRGFYRDLVVLGATQPPPYGRGWSDETLAAWLGCANDDAAELRARAVAAGREYHRGSAPAAT